MKNEFNIADITLAKEGHIKIDWAWEHMPVLKLLAEKKQEEKPLAGITIGACLHLEAKTACLLKVLNELGATVVAAGSNPLSTQDPVCAALVEYGIHVFSKHNMTTDEYNENLRNVLLWHPNIIIDDGADVISMIIREHKALIPEILGGCEETTTGIKRLKAMAGEGVLPFPMLAVNDARSKHLFDNRYGTGQSVWDAILRTTNLIVAGKIVVVVGYGWCGKGVSRRASGLGARVVVVEIDPHKALEALMDGFETMNMKDASRLGDIFITVTGNIKVIRSEHFLNMKDGALLANAGHFDVEVYIPDLKKLAVRTKKTRDNIESYIFTDGKKLHVLGEGRLVNLAAADGHPVEIMDLSFAMQLLSVLYLSQNRLSPGLHPVPETLDKEIASLKLETLGVEIERMTQEQEEYIASWRE